MKYSAITQKQFKNLPLEHQQLINKMYKETTKSISKIIEVSFDAEERNKCTLQCWDLYNNAVNQIKAINNII